MNQNLFFRWGTKFRALSFPSSFYSLCYLLSNCGSFSFVIFPSKIADSFSSGEEQSSLLNQVPQRRSFNLDLFCSSLQQDWELTKGAMPWGNAVRRWAEMQDGQRILLTTPSVLVGFRVEVYRAEGTTQWYTAVIVGYNESTKVSLAR